MYASRASPWPLNQHVWTSRRGTCFWAGLSCMCNERNVKSVWRKAKCTHYIERVQECDRVFEPHRTWRYGSLSRRPRAFFASLSYSSFSMQASRCWGCIYALSSPPFSHQAPSSFFLAPITQLLPFWRRDNETASAATALRMINLCKCIQLFVNRMF